MAESDPKIYEFGPFRLDVPGHRLLRGGEEILLTPKVFDLLVLLAQNPGRLMEKERLLKALWPDSFVEEANLNVNVSALRRALGETPAAPQYIETVPRRGYRFIADVREPVDGAAGAEPVEENLVEQATVEQTPARLRPRRRRVLRLALPVAAVIILSAAVALYLWLSRPAADREGLTNVRTIAILPFKPLVGGTGDEALETGMADALITKLSNVPQVTVRPTSAVLRYAADGSDPLAAGRELKVDAVLDGRVQRAENRVRVTVQLLRVSDGKPLWAEGFDDYFTNIFAVQESISEKVVSALALKLNPTERQSLARRYTENTEAYQLYLQARYFYFKYEFQKALDFYRAAVAKDPEYPLAYAGLAEDYVALAVTTADRQAMRDKAVEAANKALSLDPNLAEAYDALGWLKFLADWDWAGAEVAIRRAIELNPNDPDAHSNYAALLSVLGRHDEAQREAERALQLDPTSSEVNFTYAHILFMGRRYDEALAQGERAYELDPD
ncbi:MAG TPA: winged helix-turn-helix domain-containing protein, partial [Pyrinomonadaceae bacterium]|nr:winged helix-turn-helix domain-containing protein [Pyrinomonadaceae bacterium]